MIDTTATASKKKEHSTPAKQERPSANGDEKRSKTKANGLTSVPKVGNIFSTIKASNGPKNNGYHPAPAQQQAMYDEQESSSSDVDVDDEEFKAQQKLLELLEKDDDADYGVAIDVNSGDEAPAESKPQKGAKGARARDPGELDEEEDEDMMGDDY